jgi:phosphate transport system protein
MERHFHQHLAELKEKLLAMASHAESAVAKSVKSVVDRDDKLAHDVIVGDDILDRYEMEMDDMAIKLLALQGPVASDLRLVTVAMKISHDLERVGDEATTISRRSIELAREPQLKAYVHIPRMGEMALAMLKDALDSFVHRQLDKAKAVIKKDKEVDALNKQVYREMVGYMTETPATVTRCLAIMFISKSLERIADHATNIAEEAVYLYEGRDIRHSGKQGLGMEGSGSPSPLNS